MRTTRRIVAAALATGLAGAMLAPAAFAGQQQEEFEAERTEQFAGEAKATAVHLELLGVVLTTSQSTASIDFRETHVRDEPDAAFVLDAESAIYESAASALSVVTPLLTGEVASEASGADANGGRDEVEPCLIQAVEDFPLLGEVAPLVDVTCPEAEAHNLNSLPTAEAHSEEIKLGVGLGDLLDLLGLQDLVNDDLVPTVTGTVDALLGPVADILGIRELFDATLDSVEEVVNDLTTLPVLVEVALAPALTRVETTPEFLEATAKGAGLTIRVLPHIELLEDLLEDPNLQGAFSQIFGDISLADQPLLTIEVAPTEGRSVYDRATRETRATSTSSIVTVKIGSLPLLAELGLAGQEISIGDLGTEELCLPPLLCLSLAQANSDGAGFTGSSLGVRVLPGLLDGGDAVNIDLGSIAGETGNERATRTEVLPLEVTPRPTPDEMELARTGATPWIALTGMVLLGLAIAGRRLSLSRD